MLPFLSQASEHVDLDQVTDRVRRVFAIESTTIADGRTTVARFRGHLIRDSEPAWRWLSAELRPLGCTPLFRVEGGEQVVIVATGIVAPPASRTWISLVLLGLTIISMMMSAGLNEWLGQQPAAVVEPIAGDVVALLWTGLQHMDLGWPFMVSMIAILGAHELGHFIAARIHREPASPPYFIPLPLSLLGTLGAVINLKAPPANKRVLLDIGAAGPIAGLVVAIPVLIVGLMLSAPLRALPVDQVTGFEGNSILYVLLKWLVFGRFLPEPAALGDLPGWLTMLRFYGLGVFPAGGGTDVFLGQVAWAGWAGLLVTSLNLIPAGQLDGGHALYVLIGPAARRLVPAIVAVLVVLGFFWMGWFLWAGLVLLLGRTHAEPLDQITELDPVRRWVAVGLLVAFVFVFMPVPLQAGF